MPQKLKLPGMEGKFVRVIWLAILAMGPQAHADTVLQPYTIYSLIDGDAEAAGGGPGNPPQKQNLPTQTFTGTDSGAFQFAWSGSTSLSSVALLTGIYPYPTPQTTAPTPFVTGAISVIETETNGSKYPAVSNGYAAASINDTLTYYVEVGGPSGTSVPINYSGELSVSDPSITYAEQTTQAYLGIGGVGSWQILPGAPSQTINVSGQTNMTTGVPYVVQEEIHLGDGFQVGGLPLPGSDSITLNSSVSAFVDPTFSFANPSDASTYTLEYSPGIVPETPGQAPTPAALPLFITGLGGLALLGWRRKRQAQSVA